MILLNVSEKKQYLLEGYKMISFDGKSLFTNFSLEETIAVILREVYDKSKIKLISQGRQ